MGWGKRKRSKLGRNLESIYLMKGMLTKWEGFAVQTVLEVI